MPEPEKFYLGIIDFFSILLPGAVLTYTLRLFAEPMHVDLAKLVSQSEAENWSVFLVIAYVLGHFIFLIGAVLLDRLYDGIVEWQQQQLNTEKFLPLQYAKNLKTHCLTEAGIPEKTINTFQWAKCRLAQQSPLCLSHVQRFEADSKFFRSFTCVLFVLLLIFAANGHCGYAMLSVVFFLLSFWRYYDQRFKSTRQAYWYLVTLENNPKPVSTVKDQPAAEAISVEAHPV